MSLIERVHTNFLSSPKRVTSFLQMLSLALLVAYGTCTTCFCVCGVDEQTCSQQGYPVAPCDGSSSQKFYFGSYSSGLQTLATKITEALAQTSDTEYYLCVGPAASGETHLTISMADLPDNKVTFLSVSDRYFGNQYYPLKLDITQAYPEREIRILTDTLYSDKFPVEIAAPEAGIEFKKIELSKNSVLTGLTEGMKVKAQEIIAQDLSLNGLVIDCQTASITKGSDECKLTFSSEETKTSERIINVLGAISDIGIVDSGFAFKSRTTSTTKILASEKYRFICACADLTLTSSSPEVYSTARNLDLTLTGDATWALSGSWPEQTPSDVKIALKKSDYTLTLSDTIQLTYLPWKFEDGCKVTGTLPLLQRFLDSIQPCDLNVSISGNDIEHIIVGPTYVKFKGTSDVQFDKDQIKVSNYRSSDENSLLFKRESDTTDPNKLVKLSIWCKGGEYSGGNTIKFDETWKGYNEEGSEEKKIQVAGFTSGSWESRKYVLQYHGETTVDNYIAITGQAEFTKISYPVTRFCFKSQYASDCDDKDLVSVSTYEELKSQVAGHNAPLEIHLVSALAMDQELLMGHDVTFKQGYAGSIPSLKLNIQSSEKIEFGHSIYVENCEFGVTNTQGVDISLVFTGITLVSVNYQNSHATLTSGQRTFSVSGSTSFTCGLSLDTSKNNVELSCQGGGYSGYLEYEISSTSEDVSISVTKDNSARNAIFTGFTQCKLTDQKVSYGSSGNVVRLTKLPQTNAPILEIAFENGASTFAVAKGLEAPSDFSISITAEELALDIKSKIGIKLSSDVAVTANFDTLENVEVGSLGAKSVTFATKTDDDPLSKITLKNDQFELHTNGGKTQSLLYSLSSLILHNSPSKITVQRDSQSLRPETQSISVKMSADSTLLFDETWLDFSFASGKKIGITAESSSVQNAVVYIWIGITASNIVETQSPISISSYPPTDFCVSDTSSIKCSDFDGIKVFSYEDLWEHVKDNHVPITLNVDGKFTMKWSILEAHDVTINFYGQYGTSSTVVLDCDSAKSELTSEYSLTAEKIEFELKNSQNVDTVLNMKDITLTECSLGQISNTISFVSHDRTMTGNGVATGYTLSASTNDGALSYTESYSDKNAYPINTGGTSVGLPGGTFKNFASYEVSIKASSYSNDFSVSVNPTSEDNLPDIRLSVSQKTSGTVLVGAGFASGSLTITGLQTLYLSTKSKVGFTLNGINELIVDADTLANYEVPESGASFMATERVSQISFEADHIQITHGAETRTLLYSKMGQAPKIYQNAKAGVTFAKGTLGDELQLSVTIDIIDGYSNARFDKTWTGFTKQIFTVTSSKSVSGLVIYWRELEIDSLVSRTEGIEKVAYPASSVCGCTGYSCSSECNGYDTTVAPSAIPDLVSGHNEPIQVKVVMGSSVTFPWSVFAEHDVTLAIKQSSNRNLVVDLGDAESLASEHTLSITGDSASSYDSSLIFTGTKESVDVQIGSLTVTDLSGFGLTNDLKKVTIRENQRKISIEGSPIVAALRLSNGEIAFRISDKGSEVVEFDDTGVSVSIANSGAFAFHGYTGAITAQEYMYNEALDVTMEYHGTNSLPHVSFVYGNSYNPDLRLSFKGSNWPSSANANPISFRHQGRLILDLESTVPVSFAEEMSYLLSFQCLKLLNLESLKAKSIGVTTKESGIVRATIDVDKVTLATTTETHEMTTGFELLNELTDGRRLILGITDNALAQGSSLLKSLKLLFDTSVHFGLDASWRTYDKTEKMEISGPGYSTKATVYYAEGVNYAGICTSDYSTQIDYVEVPSSKFCICDEGDACNTCPFESKEFVSTGSASISERLIKQWPCELVEIVLCTSQFQPQIDVASLAERNISLRSLGETKSVELLITDKDSISCVQLDLLKVNIVPTVQKEQPNRKTILVESLQLIDVVIKPDAQQTFKLPEVTLQSPLGTVVINDPPSSGVSLSINADSSILSMTPMTTFTVSDNDVSLVGTHHIKLTGLASRMSLTCIEEEVSVEFTATKTTPVIELNVDKANQIHFGKWSGSSDAQFSVISRDSSTKLDLEGPIALKLDDQSSFDLTLDSAQYLQWNQLRACSLQVSLSKFTSIDIGEQSVAINLITPTLNDNKVIIDRTTYTGPLTLIDHASTDFAVNARNSDGSSCTKITEHVSLKLSANRELTVGQEWGNVENVKSMTINGESGGCHIIYTGSGKFPDFTVEGDIEIDVIGHNDGNKLSPGAIAGISIACIVVCVAIVFIAVICIKKRSYHQLNTNSVIDTDELNTVDTV